MAKSGGNIAKEVFVYGPTFHSPKYINKQDGPAPYSPGTVYDATGNAVTNPYFNDNGSSRSIFNNSADNLNSDFSNITRSLGQQEAGGDLDKSNSQLFHDYQTNRAFNSLLGRDPTEADYQRYHGTDIADVSGLLQGTADQGTINDLGQQQYNKSLDFIKSDAAARSSGRDQLANLLTKQATNSFSRTLPNIAESTQAAHLYDTTGYGQEVARQQSYLGQDIANQLGQVGLQDINIESQRGAAAQDALSQSRQAGLSRNLSVQDYINQTRRAKLLGQQAAPTVPSSGKQGQTGATLSGAGAGASAGAAFGPYGAAIGGVAGGAAGYFGSR